MTKDFDFNSLTYELVNCGDTQIALRTMGEGTPLILLHGWPVSGYTWRFLLPELSKYYKCYILDLPGLGSSTWSDDSDLHIKKQAKRILSFIKNYQLSNYTILAQNSGGAIARLVALEAADNIKNLILINTEVPNHRPPWIPLYQVLSKLPLAAFFFKQLLKSPLFLRSPMGFKGFYSNKNLLKDATYIMPYVEPLVNSKKRLQGALKYLIGVDLKCVDTFVPLHQQISAKVLLLWGANDPTFPVKYGRAMAQQFKNASFVALSNTALMPQEEDPEMVLDEIFKFLEK